LPAGGPSLTTRARPATQASEGRLGVPVGRALHPRRPRTSGYVELVQHTIRFADTHGIAGDHFEFQMLYGVRPQLQLDLVRRGYKVLIATPYGPEWYPYLMRRLGERPANLVFFLRNSFRG